jgi:hypothetical protein
LRVFERRLQKRIFEPRREEITRDYREFGNENFRNIYTSPYVVRIIETSLMR